MGERGKGRGKGGNQTKNSVCDANACKFSRPLKLLRCTERLVIVMIQALIDRSPEHLPAEYSQALGYCTVFVDDLCILSPGVASVMWIQFKA